MGTCASSEKATSQPRMMATFPGDPDHGKVVKEPTTSTKPVKVPKTHILKKKPRCFLDISIDGQSVGRIVIELRPDVNPRTCENFKALCTGEHGFSYKGCKFHRIVPGFVLQTGDVELKAQKKEGKGGLSIYGRSFADENLDQLTHDRYGVVSMANCGPHTNNSQFMIVVDQDGTDWLDGKHVVFGQITDESFSVLEAIEECAQVFDRGEKQRARIIKTAVITDCGQL